jgi:hypothetical protein
MQLEIKSKFIKAKDVVSGDLITFLSEGELKDSKFQDINGNIKKQFNIVVKHQGSEKILTMNEMSKKNMIVKLGKDTKSWIGKEATIQLIKMNIQGQVKDVIYLE